MVDDEPLVRLRRRPPAGALQRVRIHRLDAEAHRPQPRRVQRVDQLRIEPVEPRLALEPQIQLARANFVRERHRAIALLTEQRVAEDHVRTAERVTQRPELVDDVRHGSRAVIREDPVRTVRAELRTPAAREQREAAAVRASRERHPPPRPRLHVPARKRQRIEIADLRAGHVAGKGLPLRQALDRRFGFADDHEVRVIAEQLRELRARQPDEAGADAAAARHVAPRALVPVVDERAENDCDVAGHLVSPRPDDVVSPLLENPRQIGELHARHVMEPLLERADDAGHF